MPVSTAPPEPALVALAAATGDHAIALYLLVLATLIIAIPVGLRVRATGRRPPAAHGHAASGRLLLLLAAGIAGVVGVFFAIGARLADDDPMVLADRALSDAVGRSVPPGAARAFAVLTHLGDPWMLAVLCVAAAAGLWALGQRPLALTLVLAVGGNAVLNRALKAAFERARPVYEALPAPATGYSFPSGHSSGAMVLYGMLAYVALRMLPARWHATVLVVAVAVIWTTACSRVLLRVHFASDVLAGLSSGGAWLAVCIASCEFARRSRFTARP